MLIEEFEPDVFRQVIEYIHTGCVTLQPRTLLGRYLSVHSISQNGSPGLVNAADYYGLDELKSSCLGFMKVLKKFLLSL